MNTALDYATNLRYTNKGKLLTASQKLLLILVALETDGAGVSRITIDALAARLLVNRRSAFRVINDLETSGNLAVLPQTDETGKTTPSAYALLDDQGQIIPGEPGGGRVLLMTPPREGARVLQTTPLFSREGVTDNTLLFTNEGVTDNTPIGQNRSNRGVVSNTLPPQVSPVTPSPPNLKSLHSNDLSKNGSGTEIVIPPLIDNNRGGGSREGVTGNTLSAIELWFQVIGKPYNIGLTREGAELITANVTNLPAWEFTLKGWLASNWNKTNVAGQVDRYATKVLPLPQFKPAPAPKAKSEAEQAENDRAHKLIYGTEG